MCIIAFKIEHNYVLRKSTFAKKCVIRTQVLITETNSLIDMFLYRILLGNESSLNLHLQPIKIEFRFNTLPESEQKNKIS